MSKTWADARFGQLTFEEFYWSTRIAVPAFAVYSYRPEFALEILPDGECELEMHIREDYTENPPLPLPELCAVVERVLQNQSLLAPAVATALWKEFEGSGPRSGMWWHGNIPLLMEHSNPSLPPLDGPDAIYSLLRLVSVEGRPRGPGYRDPLVTLTFDAEFDEEHGIGVLTDGDSVVGIGYGGDPSPFAR
jgi:hypothetical protein